MRELYGMFMKMEKEGKPDDAQEEAQNQDTTQSPIDHTFDIRNATGDYDGEKTQDRAKQHDMSSIRNNEATLEMFNTNSARVS